MKVLDRRTFLRGTGAAMIGLPWLNAMQASAQANVDAPKRVVWFFTPNGFNREHWPTNMNLDGTTLAPLKAMRNKIIITRGLSMESGYLDSDPDGSHINGIHHALTGEKSQNAGRANGSASFDLYASQKIAQYRQSMGLSPLKQRELILGAFGEGDELSSSAANSPVKPINRPHDVFNLVFKDLKLDNQPVNPGEQLKNLKKKSILDYLSKSTAPICNSLGQEDRHRVQAHLHSIRELEKKLSNGYVTSPSCAIPQAPDNNQCPAGGIYDPICGSYKTPTISLPWIAEQQMRLLAMALACDVTRVGGLKFFGFARGGTLSFVKHLGWIDPGSKGKSISQDHHSASHNTDKKSRDAVLSLNHYYAGLFADFLGYLDSYPEGNGTVLDNTVVCWVSECGLTLNSHPRRNLGIVLGGGGGGRFKTGQYVNFGPALNKQKGGTLIEGGNEHTPGRPHNDLLVELINTVLPKQLHVSSFGGKQLSAKAANAGIQLNSGGLPEIRV